MEFKHTLFLSVIICSLWALTVVGLTNAKSLGSSIKINSELPTSEEGNVLSDLKVGDQFNSMVSVLNLGLPVALFGLVILGLMYNNNPIGLGSLVVAIGLFLFSSSKTLDAVDQIQARSEFSLDTRVWWM